MRALLSTRACMPSSTRWRKVQKAFHRFHPLGPAIKRAADQSRSAGAASLLGYSSFRGQVLVVTSRCRCTDGLSGGRYIMTH